MPHCCIIPGCRSNSKKNPELSFHYFPRNKFKFQQWTENIIPALEKQGIFNFKPHHTQKICGKHFVGGKRTSQHHVPTIFHHCNSANHSKDYETVNTDNLVITMPSQDVLNDVMDTMDVVTEIVMSSCEEVVSGISNEDPNIDVSHWSISQNETSSNLDLDETSSEVSVLVVSDEHSYSYHADEKDETISSLKNEVESLKKLVLELVNTNNLLKAEVDELKSSEQPKTPEVKARALYKEIVNDEKKLRYYTGFSSKKLYDKLYNFLEEDFPFLKFYDIKHCDTEKLHRKSALSMDIQFLITLMRLRLNLDGQDIAYRFNVSSSTISRYWITWIHFLSTRLRQIPQWPTTEILDQYRPAAFKEKGYETVDGILDATEIFIETPSSYRVQSETYSNYKHHNTVKGLVLCSPNGFVMFESDLAPGRLSDKELTIESKLLDKFERGRSLMVDRGFLIEKECEERGLTLNIPPFMRGREQLSKEDEMETRRIANLRIHVERVINRIKVFRILSGVFPNSMHTQLNSIWHICCRLVNWIDKPLLD